MDFYGKPMLHHSSIYMDIDNMLLMVYYLYR
jgi:hypothetical protein